ncbi:MAG: LacI family DNA-binding transcriptional regulator [Sphaerochaetaceae bacterium]|nr:LacI family DNA-binding transcriptional regulator [Sphaerochaetaceae bacterium]
MEKDFNKRPTLKDISKETGFSITTVSLVLNNKKNRISEKSKNKIKAVAKKMDYRPNQLAVGLVKQRTKIIGVIVSDISNEFFANLTKGIENGCRKLGYNIILCNTEDSYQNCLNYINILADKGVDGLILGMSVDMNLKKAQECDKILKFNNIPYITIDRFFKELDCSAVISDNKQGAYLATSYLIKNGHKKIAYISGPSQLTDSKERLKGYKKALAENNIEFIPNCYFEGDYSQESGKEAFYNLQGKDFTAVFAFNGLMTFGFYHEANKNKINIPDDISLVGYDDLFFLDVLNPPITTVKQPVYQMGNQAAKEIYSLVHNKSKEKHYNVLQPELLIRESVKKIIK